MRLSKKRIEEIINTINSPLMKQIIAKENVKAEDIFTEDERVLGKWNSESELAEEILHKINVKFNHARGKLYTFNKIWKMEPEHNKTVINETIRAIAKCDKYPTEDINYSKINQEIMFEANEFSWANQSERLLTSTRYKIYIFRNGTLYYNQKTGEWDFKKDYFNPDDNVRDEENPMFDYDFVESINGLTNLFRVFWEWGPGKLKQIVYLLSYMIFCEKDYLNVMFYLVGRGSNGKSMLLKLIEQLFPSGTVTHMDISKMNGDKDGSQALEKSYVNASGEIRMEDFDTIFFKKITGGDAIDVNIKNEKELLRFVPHAKHIVSSNEDPTLRTTTHGDLRRFLILRFDNQFKTVQNFYEDRMAPFIPQLFYFCLLLSKKIKQGKMFINPQFLSDTKDILREKSSSVYQFMKEFDIIYDTTVLNNTSKNGRDDRKIYAKYQVWCKRVGRQAFSKQRFFNDVDMFLNVKTKIKGTTYGRLLTINNTVAWEELIL